MAKAEPIEVRIVGLEELRGAIAEFRVAVQEAHGAVREALKSADQVGRSAAAARKAPRRLGDAF